jgi:hypothetical protein
MLKKISFCFLIIYPFIIAAQPVFKNPGIPASESFEILDFINKEVGFVTTKIEITLKERNHLKYYFISVNEGNIFSDEIEVNYDDLTTISEKRVDLKTKNIVEYYTKAGNIVHFLNNEKHINKNFQVSDKNIYSRYAYFFSFRGFPFEASNSVTFKSYMYEYGDALTMKVTNVGEKNVTVKAGTFNCYKLELSLAGWQSIFASDKFYLYFKVEPPHNFIKYEENDGGVWVANELLKINK